MIKQFKKTWHFTKLFNNHKFNLRFSLSDSNLYKKNSNNFWVNNPIRSLTTQKSVFLEI